MNKAQHVVPNRDGGWAVRRTGFFRASRVFSKKLAAVQNARREGSALYVHCGDATIKDKNDFGAN